MKSLLQCNYKEGLGPPRLYVKLSSLSRYQAKKKKKTVALEKQVAILEFCTLMISSQFFLSGSTGKWLGIWGLMSENPDFNLSFTTY